MKANEAVGPAVLGKDAPCLLRQVETMRSVPPEARNSPAAQPRKSESPNSHRGTISGTCSSQKSWTVTEATQETEKSIVAEAEATIVPPRRQRNFFSTHWFLGNREQSDPRPESRNPKSASPWEATMRIRDTWSSRGINKKDSKALQTVPASSCSTQISHRPMFHVTISLSSRLNFFHFGRTVVAHEQTQPRKVRNSPPSWAWPRQLLAMLAPWAGGGRRSCGLAGMSEPRVMGRKLQGRTCTFSLDSCFRVQAAAEAGAEDQQGWGCAQA